MEVRQRVLLLEVTRKLRREPTGYLIVAGLFVVAFLVRYAFVGVVPNAPFVTFFPVVVVATLISGRASGAAVAALSVIAAWYFFAPPDWVVGRLWPDGPVSIALYLLTCAFLIWIADLLMRAMDALERERDRSAALFQELQHRVANTMQFVSSMLSIEAKRLGSDTHGHAVLMASSRRLAQFGRLHRLLYSPDIVDHPMQALLEQVCGEITGSLHRDNITVSINAPHKLESDRVLPFCLLVAELVTNAAKHAFPDGRRGHIRVTLAHGQEQLILSIEDDGCGMPSAGQPSGGLGSKIISSLIQQLGGELSISSGEGGTKAQATFPARQ